MLNDTVGIGVVEYVVQCIYMKLIEPFYCVFGRGKISWRILIQRYVLEIKTRYLIYNS